MDSFRRQRHTTNFLVLMLALACMQLTGCATTGVEKSQEIVAGDPLIDAKEEREEQSDVDPYEGFNRAMYSFNDVVDRYFAQPIITGYKWVTPELLQTGVSNAFANMKGINVLLNDFLQGKFKQGAEDSGRFLLNSTLGLAGIFDVATELGLEEHDEDFGQTLAVWGVPRGPYLVLPVLGPGSFRGVPGAAFDIMANPVTYLGWPVAVMAAVDTRANADGALKFVDEAAVDPYVFTRESYIQWREYLARDGQQDLSEDFFEDEEELFLEDSDADGLMLTAEAVNYQVVAENSTGNAVKGSDPEKQNTANGTILEDASQPNGKPIEPSVEAQQQPVEKPVQSEEQPVETSEEMNDFDKAWKAFDKARKDYKKAEKDLEILRTRGSKYIQEKKNK